MTRRYPHADVDVERQIVASILYDPEVAALLEDLDASDFHSQACAATYMTLRRMHRLGKPIDLTTVRAELEAIGDLSRAGGDEGLLSFVESIPVSDHVEGYAQIVRDHAAVRRMLAAAGQTWAQRENPIDDARAFLDATAAKALKIATSAHGDDTVRRLGDVLPEVRADLVERKRRGGLSGLSTGFGGLDRLLTGLTPGQLVIVAGRPGMGKSALVQAFMLSAARSKKPAAACAFSLEMSASEWVHRMAMSQASVDGTRARRGLLNQGEWSRYNTAEQTLARLPIFIDDTPALTPEQLRARARRVHAREGLGLVVVDYVQLMTSSNPRASSEETIAAASKGLKALAKELQIPVVACAQLNREVERRGGDKRPTMSDLRQSGQIEQDADVIAFVFRECVYEPKKADPRAAEIIVRKQRMGPTGTIRVQFRAEYTRFEDVDPEDFHGEQRQLGGPRGL